MQCPLTVSDVIEICGIIASLITSIVAIVISVKTLRQNSKMIEESTRPYVSIYIGNTYFSTVNVYLIIKNFGSSSAVINGFETDIDLTPYAYDENRVPFTNIIGTTLCPGESMQYPIKLENAPDSLKTLKISLKYRSDTHQYNEDICLNLSAHFDAVHLRANSDKSVSYALQDIAEKML